MDENEGKGKGKDENKDKDKNKDRDKDKYKDKDQYKDQYKDEDKDKDRDKGKSKGGHLKELHPAEHGALSDLAHQIEVELVLIRHGHTQWNAERRYLGQTDLPLLPDAHQQLSALRSQPVLSREFSRVYCSDLRRCKETLADMAPHLERQAIFDPRLREADFGAWEGCTYEQLKDNRHYRSWIDDPGSVTPPDGEPWEEFAARVDNFWSLLQREAEAGLWSGVGVSTGAGGSAEAGADIGAGASAEAGADVGTGVGAITGAGERTGAGEDSNAGKGAGANSGASAEAAVDTGVGASAKVEAGADVGALTGSGAVLVHEASVRPEEHITSGCTPETTAMKLGSTQVPKVYRVLLVTHGGVIRQLLARIVEGMTFYAAAAPAPGEVMVMNLRCQAGVWRMISCEI
ncbi:histidine phosphatase family protein [Paenibacillus tritici]|nr:histidine phosphatase family protein [Paenibacillus tritici]